MSGSLRSPLTPPTRHLSTLVTPTRSSPHPPHSPHPVVTLPARHPTIRFSAARPSILLLSEGQIDDRLPLDLAAASLAVFSLDDSLDVSLDVTRTTPAGYKLFLLLRMLMMPCPRPPRVPQLVSVVVSDREQLTEQERRTLNSITNTNEGGLVIELDGTLARWQQQRQQPRRGGAGVVRHGVARHGDEGDGDEGDGDEGDGVRVRIAAPAAAPMRGGGAGGGVGEGTLPVNPTVPMLVDTGARSLEEVDVGGGGDNGDDDGGGAGGAVVRAEQEQPLAMETEERERLLGEFGGVLQGFRDGVDGLM